MLNFALIGAAGYVAPRHMRAIRDTGNDLVAALDKFDSVGIIDSYFPKADFFVEFERFDRHLEKLRRKSGSLDFVSICSPNYLHDSHIRFGLRHGANVICEKPVVLNPWNIDALHSIEAETGLSVFTILQLRLHPRIIELREWVQGVSEDHIFDIELTYLTTRGHWYYTSWKGDLEKSGGIATNIGIHFFDILIWIFGDMQESEVHVHSHDRTAGYLQLRKARVKWFVGIDGDLVPLEARASGQSVHRSLILDGEEYSFTGHFGDLHTQSYEAIIAGAGHTLEEARPAIDLVYQIRHSAITGVNQNSHYLASIALKPHPFLSGPEKDNR